MKTEIETLADLKQALREAIAPAMCRFSQPHHHAQAVADVDEILREIHDKTELM